MLTLLSLSNDSYFILISSTTAQTHTVTLNCEYEYQSMSMNTIIDTIYTPATTSYSDILKTIININTLIYKNGTIAPTLDSIKNVRSLYELLGCPLDNLHVIHVTGTNGKGTTCWKLHSAFCAIGIIYIFN